MKFSHPSLAPLGRAVLGVLIFFLILGIGLEIGARVLLRTETFFGRVQGNDEASHRLSWVRGRSGSAPFLSASYDRYHPIRGWTPVPDLHDEPVFFRKTLSTNARGLRGKRNYSYARTPGMKRILTLGDSFTFGEGVSDHETYSNYLERMLPSTEVVNLGVHGYGHDQMLLYLQEEGLKYHPDILIVGFLYYDLERNLFSFRDFAKPRFITAGNKLILRSVPVPSPADVLSRELFRSKAADLWTIYYNRFAWASGRNEKKMKKLGEALLDKIVKIVSEEGIRPILVYFPTELDFEELFDRPSKRESFFLDYCDARPELSCVSVRPLFMNHLKQGRSLVIYGHWDYKGQLLAALAIRQALTRQGFYTKEKNRIAQKETF